MIRAFGNVSKITNQPPGLLVGLGSGNALPSDVSLGKRFTNDRGQQTGTMPIYNTADSSNYVQVASGTPGAIYVRPSQGNWQSPGSIMIPDPNFVPANIRKDVNLFGLAGTLVEGPQTHKLPAAMTWSNVNVPANDGITVATQNVTGLPFTPKFVAITGSGNWTGYTVGDLSAFGTTDSTNYMGGSTTSYPPVGSYRFTISVSITGVTSGGCSVNIYMNNFDNNTRQSSGTFNVLLIG